MTLPVVKTVFDNIERTWRALPLLWYYAQAPTLIVGLLGCAALAVYLIAGDATFIMSETVEGEERIRPTGWLTAFQFAFAYGVLFLLLPFYITWMRYVTAGPAGLVGRPLWHVGNLEWGFVRGALLALGYLIGVGLAIGIAMAVLGSIVAFIAPKPEGEPGGALVGIGIVIVGVIYAWLTVLIVRAMATFLPMAFGERLDIARALRITKPIQLRVIGMFILLGVISAIPILPVAAIITSMSDGDSIMTSKPWLFFQMFQPLIFLPFNIFFTAVAIGIYADIWRTPEGNAEWPVANFPLVPAEPPRQSTQL